MSGLSKYSVVAVSACLASAILSLAALGETPAAQGQSVAVGAVPVAGPQPVFNIQLWDAQKTDWLDSDLDELQKMGFTVVQNGYGGSFFPSKARLDQVTSHGLQYGAYVNTLELFRQESTDAEKLAVRYAVGVDGVVLSGEYNSFDPVYQEVVRRGITKSFQKTQGAPGLYKVMFNSERNAPISYDSLTVDQAVRAGVMQVWQKIPTYDRGVWRLPTGANAADYAEPYGFIHWFDNEGGDNAINRVAMAAVRACDPNVRVTTDPLADGLTYGEYSGMDIMQDWLRVHRAPRDPLAMAYHVERLKASVRRQGGGEVWVGPQLGSADDGVTYAAPADEFEESLWLAVAFGVRGLTFWGYNTVRRDSRLDMDTWRRITKFHTLLNGSRSVLLGATDEPRACAVLISKANQVFSTHPYYEVENNYEHFYRALLSGHVQADVLYDEDVLDGALANYKALFLPGIEYLTPELQTAVNNFEAAGGRVIRWRYLKIAYQDYYITQGLVSETVDLARPNVGSLLPHQYRMWRYIEAGKIYLAVSDLLDVKCDNPAVVVNVIRSGGKRYAVLVNDRRTYGKWTTERGFRWCEDLGRGTRTVLTYTRSDGTEKNVRATVPRAGTRIVPLQ